MIRYKTLGKMKVHFLIYCNVVFHSKWSYVKNISSSGFIFWGLMFQCGRGTIHITNDLKGQNLRVSTGTTKWCFSLGWYVLNSGGLLSLVSLTDQWESGELINLYWGELLEGIWRLSWQTLSWQINATAVDCLSLQMKLFVWIKSEGKYSKDLNSQNDVELKYKCVTFHPVWWGQWDDVMVSCWVQWPSCGY